MSKDDEITMLRVQVTSLEQEVKETVKSMTGWFRKALHFMLCDRKEVRDLLAAGAPVRLSARDRHEHVVLFSLAEEQAFWEALEEIENPPPPLVIEARVLKIETEPSKETMEQIKTSMRALSVFYQDGYVCVRHQLTGEASAAVRKALAPARAGYSYSGASTTTV